MSFFWALLLVIVLLAGWVLTLVGMPGNWLMVAAAAVYMFLVPEQSSLHIGWQVVAVLGEQWKGRTLDASWQVGKAAFWGRLLGTLGKTAVASVMVVVAAAALVL